jgi:hypothetical protein
MVDINDAKNCRFNGFLAGFSCMTPEMVGKIP